MCCRAARRQQVDFQDCYNTILYAVAKHFHFLEDLIKLLYDMTEDKDKFRQDVARFYGCTPKAAKNLLLKHWMAEKWESGSKTLTSR